MEARPKSTIPRNRPKTCQPRSQRYQPRSSEYSSSSFKSKSRESELFQQNSNHCEKSNDCESSCGVVNRLEKEDEHVDEFEESEWFVEHLEREQMFRPESRLGSRVPHKRPGTAPFFKKRRPETGKRYSDQDPKKINDSEGLVDEYEYYEYEVRH